MIPRLALALSLSLLAGCADRPLPVASGPVRQLNVGKWTPRPGDLAVPSGPTAPPVVASGSASFPGGPS